MRQPDRHAQERAIAAAGEPCTPDIHGCQRKPKLKMSSRSEGEYVIMKFNKTRSEITTVKTGQFSLKKMDTSVLSKRFIQNIFNILSTTL
jgi:hypothetical protein